MKENNQHEFKISTFKVGGLSKEEKHEQLIRGIEKYNVDVPCLQETKIKDYNREINGKLIITFETKVKDYGNGFVINKRWKNSIYGYWKVSDRICVLQLEIENRKEANIQEQSEYIITETKYPNLKLTKKNTDNRKCFVDKHHYPYMTIKAEKNKRLITIINL